MNFFRKLITIALISHFPLGLISAINPVGDVQAQTTITWPTIEYQLLTQDLERPVHLTHANDGSNRLFIVEQVGRVRIFNGTLQTTPFLDITERVHSPISGGGAEEGLLSIAFPPDYGDKGYFYIYYTKKDTGDNQISRFYLTGNPDIADPNSEELILYLEHPIHTNHNGGQLAFGPDNYLYIGTGDGGGSGDPEDNAQDPSSLLGKILRIDVELNSSPPIDAISNVYLPLLMQSNTTTQISYRIPPDNPFVGIPGYRGEIWAVGLRNPWRFSFDTSNGDLYIGDVGQGSVEEIDYQPGTSLGGQNYGWDIMEGDICFPGPPCEDTGLTLPIYTYPHGLGCSITGGYVYRGSSYPGLQNIYLYSDYCSGFIWGLQKDGDNWENHELLDTEFNVSSFGTNEAGEIFFADLSGGDIYQIIEVNP